jgi:translocation and assembly module TamA
MIGLLLALGTGTAQASWWWPFSAKGVDYKIDIQGVDKQQMKWLKSLGITEKSEDHPPRTMDDLDQEGVAVGERIRQAMAAHGFFDAQIDQRVDKKAKPAVLHYQVAEGERYHIGGIRADWQGKVLKSIDVRTLRIHVSEPVDAEAINKQAGALQKDIGKNACLLSLKVTPLLELNNAQHAAVLVFRVEHGPRANFGPVTVAGNTRVHSDVIRRAVTWKQGQCYTVEEVNKTRSALIATQLFSTVDINVGGAVDAKDQVPVTVKVKERVPRTITAGASYATDQGFGTKFGWEHRNLFGGAEKLDVDTILAQQEQSLSVTGNKPAFLRNDQSLVLTGSIDHQDTDAYTSQDLNLGATVVRKFGKHWNVGVGGAYLLSRTDDVLSGQTNYGLISAPGFAEYDSRDNAQDAHKGFYGRFAITPYLDTFDTSVTFFQTQITAQTYLSEEKWPLKPTLALRASTGSIYGASASSLPANLRFYSGGGSVRGYSYQSLSPYFEGQPIGGASLLEFSTELRLRFTQSFGGVVFLDGGNAYASSIPHLTNKIYFGSGVGVRYYSPVGPIRFDVGVPLNGADIGQTGYAIYVSIGQAF